MALSSINVNSQNITLSMDELLPIAYRISAIVKAHLRDELTGVAPLTTVAVNASMDGLMSRVTNGGVAGVVGIPIELFSTPSLATDSYEFSVTFSVEAYLPVTQLVTLGPIVGFPNVFTPIDLGITYLHRAPTIIQGRVASNGLPAEVRISAIWLTLPSAASMPPPSLFTVVSLRSGLYGARSVASTTVRQRDLLEVLGEDKSLLVNVLAGQKTLHLSNRLNLNVADILAVSTNDNAVTEYIVIDDIAGATNVNQAATITLSYATKFNHRRQAVVRRVLPQAPGVDNNLGSDSIVGDQCLLLSTTNGLANNTLIEIDDGVQVAEYHAMSVFRVNTDANGYFSLPPLSRVAQLDFHVDAGVAGNTDIDGFVPNYSRRQQLLDVVL